MKSASPIVYVGLFNIRVRQIDTDVTSWWCYWSASINLSSILYTSIIRHNHHQQNVRLQLQLKFYGFGHEVHVTVVDRVLEKKLRKHL